MADLRSDQWEADTDGFTEEHLEAILEYCGIHIEYASATNFVVLCPYHSNRDTPAMSVSKETGLWMCFNPMCEQKGHIRKLIADTTKLGPWDVERLIISTRQSSAPSITDRLTKVLSKKYDFQEFSSETLGNLRTDFWLSKTARDYMKGRGFEDDTLLDFDIGYSEKRNLITVPLHDPKGMPVGIIGRSPSDTDKVFKNSVGLPRAKTMFNLHQAKRYGQAVIVVEASFCAMRVYQAGYPNVVALLGGHVTSDQIALFQRHFDKIIIMTDNDKPKFYPNCGKCAPVEDCTGHSPGQLLGMSLAEKLANKKIAWARYSDEEIFAHGAKDPSEMTDGEIRLCIKNEVSHFELLNSGLYATI